MSSAFETDVAMTLPIGQNISATLKTLGVLGQNSHRGHLQHPQQEEKINGKKNGTEMPSTLLMQQICLFLWKGFHTSYHCKVCAMSASFSSGSSAHHLLCKSTYSCVAMTHFERFCLQFSGGDIRTAAAILELG